MSEKKAALDVEFVKTGISLAAKKDVHHLLFVSDLPPTEEMVKARSPVRKKIIHAVTSEAQKAVLDAMGCRALILPAYELPPHEKTKIAIAAGMSEGWFKQGETVIALVARRAASLPDTMILLRVGAPSDPSTPLMLEYASRIPSQVLEAVLSLAMSIAEEGWEGHPIGTIFVIGDSTRVLEKSHQLTLNPFQGYSEAEKNIHNPRVREAIKNFAVLDGAFVIREDGVVLAAGRYLHFESDEVNVPLGLGARHTAAAGITQECDAIAVVVSQTSGVVSVFEKGRVVMRLDSKRRRIGPRVVQNRQEARRSRKTEDPGEAGASEARGSRKEPDHGGSKKETAEKGTRKEPEGEPRAKSQ